MHVPQYSLMISFFFVLKRPRMTGVYLKPAFHTGTDDEDERGAEWCCSADAELP